MLADALTSIRKFLLVHRIKSFERVFNFVVKKNFRRTFSVLCRRLNQFRRTQQVVWKRLELYDHSADKIRNLFMRRLRRQLLIGFYAIKRKS